MNILKFIDVVVCADSINLRELPSELSDKEIIRFCEGNFNIAEFIKILTNAQNLGHVLIITNINAINDIAGAINSTTQSNKISVLCNSKLNSKELEKELSSKAFHTDDGLVLFPEPVDNFDGIFHSDNHLIICKKPSKKYKAVYNVKNEVVGTLLDESIKYCDLIGTVKDCIFDFEIKEKALIMLEMMKSHSDRVNTLSDILIFKGPSKSHRFIALPSSVSGSIYDAELELFTGHTLNDSITDILSSIATLKLPAVIREDLNAVLSHNFISRTFPLPKLDMLENSMNRLLI